MQSVDQQTAGHPATACQPAETPMTSDSIATRYRRRARRISALTSRGIAVSLILAIWKGKIDLGIKCVPAPCRCLLHSHLSASGCSPAALCGHPVLRCLLPPACHPMLPCPLALVVQLQSPQIPIN